jgi:hypothetical protein
VLAIVVEDLWGRERFQGEGTVPGTVVLQELFFFPHRGQTTSMKCPSLVYRYAYDVLLESSVAVLSDKREIIQCSEAAQQKPQRK